MSITTSIPADYVRCAVAEGNCLLREKCLRSKVLREDTYSEATSQIGIEVVNIWNKALKPCTNECAAFRPSYKRRFAKGFSHLFECVPKGLYESFRRDIINVFSSRRTFYYCQKGEILVTPEEQLGIDAVFRKYRLLSGPKFDAFVEEEDWRD